MIQSDGNYGSSSTGLDGAGGAGAPQGGTGEEVRLDDEMDKVFASMTSPSGGSTTDKEKFDVASLSAQPPVVEHFHDDMEYSRKFFLSFNLKVVKQCMLLS